MALFSMLEKPPAVAFVGSPSAASGIDRPAAADALSVRPVTLCTIAPEPFVPDVSTPLSCSIAQAHPVWELAPKPGSPPLPWVRRPLP
ncbi:MAG: hypothetical protein MZV70_66000 [Desulfobacterales bacterium]|nr:hypothetical protein [Desulfobacterales bacterium]